MDAMDTLQEKLTAEITRLSEALARAEAERGSFKTTASILREQLAASEAERERLVEMARATADSIERLAFNMRPPNPHTPQFVMLANSLRAALAAAPAKPAQPARDDVLEALAEFARWAISEGPWEGGHLDGGNIQEKAVELGLIIETRFDPEIHGESSEAVKGDTWFVFAPALRAGSTSSADR